MQFEVQTTTDGTKIKQEISSDCGLTDTWEILSRTVSDTAEKGFENSLKSLGWLPPAAAAQLKLDLAAERARLEYIATQMGFTLEKIGYEWYYSKCPHSTLYKAISLRDAVNSAMEYKNDFD